MKRTVHGHIRPKGLTLTTTHAGNHQKSPFALAFALMSVDDMPADTQTHRCLVMVILVANFSELQEAHCQNVHLFSSNALQYVIGARREYPG